MKLTIDTVNKTIKVEQNVKFSELYDHLLEIGISLDDYTLVATEQIINYYPYTPYVVQPVSPYTGGFPVTVTF